MRRLAGRDRAAFGAAVVLALFAAPGCGPSPTDTAARRQRLLEETAADVAGEIEAALSRGRQAVAKAAAALEAGGASRESRFAALAHLAAKARVDGLTWDGGSGAPAWAGSPVDFPDPPLDPPWHASFRSGDVTYHAGPFLRALIVSGDRSPTGFARATVLLHDPAGGLPETSIETRWALRHNVKSVHILPGDSHGASAGNDVLRVAIGSPQPGKPGMMTVEVEAPGDQALIEMALAEENGLIGGVLLAGLVLGIVLAGWILVKVVRAPRARWAGFAVLALLVREALRVIDLPDRFRGLEVAFRADDFGVTGWLGWLSSPGEYFLTGVACLAAAVGFSRAIRDLPPSARGASRALRIVLGVAISAVVSAGWLFLVESAARNGQIPYFSPGGLVPRLPRTLMLSGLSAITASAYVFAAAGSRLATQAMPQKRPAWEHLFVGALAAAGAAALAIEDLPFWAPFLIPLAGAWVGPLAPGGWKAGAPSRILLVSVLSAALLFPVLWERVDESDRSNVAFTAELLVGGEDEVGGRLPGALLDLAGNTHLRTSLERVSEGQAPPNGLALYVWSVLMLGSAPLEGNVAVYDSHGAEIDRFSWNSLPPSRLPSLDSSADTGAPSDREVKSGVEAPRRIRSTIGRLKVRGAGDREIGSVVVTAPDRMTIDLEGLRPRITATPEGNGAGDSREEDLTLALLKDGKLVASSDPTLARESPAFPAELGRVRQPTWVHVKGADGDREWLAFPAPGRGGVLLAARPRRGAEDALLALARVSVVGVGIGAVLALGVLLTSLRGFRPRLQHKILWSYFAISVVPLVFLGLASWRDATLRGEARFSERHRTVLRDVRSDLEAHGLDVIEIASDASLGQRAAELGQDMSVYREGRLLGSSLPGLIGAELLPARLPAEAFRATEIEGRNFFSHEEEFAGRKVRVGYAPIRDASGAPVATVSVPLLYDSARADQEAAETGSVLLAAYLLTLVLVVVIGIYTARSLARPLDLLSEGTKRVAAGEEDVVIPATGGDEVGGLVQAFNRMTGELKEIRARAAKAERETAWRGMARQIAHEIKNPLTPMKLMLQQLVASAQRDPSTIAPLIEPTAKVVLEQIEALKRIADDFSAFARFPPRKLVDAPVNDVLTSVAALYAGTTVRGSEIAMSLAEGLPPVHWDADELRRVFVNLVANAIEALDPTSSAGPGRVTIVSQRVRSPEGKDGVLVTIADTGVGIPPENRPRLFEPDFSTKSSGTGLGLAIVKRIVADLGGTIRLDSVVGEGTTVAVWLPASARLGV